MGTKEIFLRSLEEGPSFTTELSKTWKMAQRATFSADWERHLTEGYPTLEGSIDYIFDPKCLPRWELPDEGDWKLLLDPSPKIADDLLDLFKTKLRSKIPNDIKIPKRDLIDDLELFRASKIVESTSSWKTIPNYKAWSNMDTPYTSQFRFKRALIWKTADEVRDALICDKPTLLTLNEVGRILGYVSHTFKGYKIGAKDIYSDIKNIKESFKKDFLMVDLRKCGLTFPRELVLAALEVLKESIDSPALDKAYEAYKSNPTLCVGKRTNVKDPDTESFTEYNMTNGLGLGMLNELVTIIIETIFLIYQEEGFFPEDSMGWFLGDDQLIWWERKKKSLIRPHEICEGWENILRRFGFSIHGEKPFIGPVGQFCEQFTKTDFNVEKRTRPFSTLLEFLSATNIVHAKDLFSAMYKHWWGLSQSDNDLALELACSYWGYELSPQEKYLPIEYGGWVRFQDRGLNPALVMYDEGKIPEPYARLFFSKPKKDLFFFLKD